MKFGDLAKYKMGSDLVVSARHDKWMEKNSNPVYSQEALTHAAQELRKQAHPRDRRGTVSGSAIGSCPRKQQFTFLGMPQLPPTGKLAAIFQTGTFMHIRWQMAGLTEGWLLAAEVPIPTNDWRLSGTMDGIAYEGSVVEFKSINSNGFRQINSFGPKDMHLRQAGAYVLAGNFKRAIFIYEDKDTQEYKEIVKLAEELPLAEIAEAVTAMWDHNDAKVLYPMLPACEIKDGYIYKGCPYKDVCPLMKTWEQVGEYADQKG